MELTVSDSSENMSYWMERPYLSVETKNLLVNADVYIVPEEELREYSTPLFPSDMIALYDELKQHLNVEAAINDEDYHELALNSRIHRYGKFVVIAVVVPVFVTVLGNYISDKLKHEDPKDEVQLEIIVQNKDGLSKSIKFKGTADNFNKVAEKVKEVAEAHKDEHRTDTTKSAKQKKRR